MGRIDRFQLFLDSMGGGAWPFLVGGVICLVNSDNERDLNLLNSYGNRATGNGVVRPQGKPNARPHTNDSRPTS